MIKKPSCLKKQVLYISLGFLTLHQGFKMPDVYDIVLSNITQMASLFAASYEFQLLWVDHLLISERMQLKIKNCVHTIWYRDLFEKIQNLLKLESARFLSVPSSVSLRLRDFFPKASK